MVKKGDLSDSEVFVTFCGCLSVSEIADLLWVYSKWIEKEKKMSSITSLAEKAFFMSAIRENGQTALR